MAQSKTPIRLAYLPLPEKGSAPSPAVMLSKRSPTGPALSLRKTPFLSQAELGELADALAPVLRGRFGVTPLSASIDATPVKLRGRAEQTPTERAFVDREREATECCFEKDSTIDDIINACEDPVEIAALFA